MVAAAHADDSEKLLPLFASAEKGSTITIPPGDYRLDGSTPLPLRSHCTVMAYGARFILPEQLSKPVVLFSGKDMQDFRWIGGHFQGHVFDPARESNAWEPNANSRGILITTSPGGNTSDLLFRDLTSADLAGAAITVLGAEKPGNEREVITSARNVTIENCTLERTGKFMWDYGYLWQITVWPEDFDARERAVAEKYFRADLVRDDIGLNDGDDRVRLSNKGKPIPVSPNSEPQTALCFFGGNLPKNITRGRQYFVVESQPDHIKIATQPGGTPIRFEGSGDGSVKLIQNLFAAHLALYAPTGSGPGKGALDLVGCDKVIVRGCRLSALGDTMHIQKCRGIVFTGNQITGSRMGAFFLAEFCKDATITGNTVDGTNGSRVISVEKSCEDVTITGNTFRNGGRGSWINQPKNFVMTSNVFVNNTTKNEHQAKRGRRTFQTGNYEEKPELYFTLHEKGGSYGPVIVRDNLFTLGRECGTPAVTFAPGGHDLIFQSNTFIGPAVIHVDPTVTNSQIRDNPGAEVKSTSVDFNHGRR